ncbi:hypothetical protein [Pseudomonas matsuisoli]|nr:hypothetical protein [Pseudomonas matsuisoli]
MELSIQNFKKWTLGVIGTILLGAIGSGVWEWVLSDLFSWLGNNFILFASSISQTFVESLYKEVWRGQNFPYLRETYILTFVIYIMLPFMLGVFSRGSSNRNTTTAKKTKPKLYIAIVMLCSIAVMMTIKIWQTSFTERVASTLQANTLILAPFITDVELMELNSSFASVDSESTAIELKSKLESLSVKHKIKLHDMSFM